MLSLYHHWSIQGATFPELTKKLPEIKEILDEEEESFSRTLDRGEKLFEQYAASARERGVRELNGKDVWRLYDTYGFPVDLTRLMAEELGLTINEREFEAAQASSKEASKASQKKHANSVVKLDVHDLATLEKNIDVPKTDDSAKFCKFIHSSPRPITQLIVALAVGNVEATVKAIYFNKSFFQTTSNVSEDTSFGIILDRTSFYAESGGQEHDTGNIVIDGFADFQVTNVQVYNGYVLHIGYLKYGKLSVGDKVVASYDEVNIILQKNAFMFSPPTFLAAPSMALAQ